MVPVYAMAIADREEMQSELSKHVRDEYIGVLIRFVRVAGLVADRRGKCKLRDAVESLGCYFDWQLVAEFWLLAALVAWCLLLALLLALIQRFVIRRVTSILGICSGRGRLVVVALLPLASHLNRVVSGPHVIGGSSGADRPDRRFAGNP